MTLKANIYIVVTITKNANQMTTTVSLCKYFHYNLPLPQLCFYGTFYKHTMFYRDHRLLSIVCCPWFMVYGAWSMVYGPQSMVHCTKTTFKRIAMFTKLPIEWWVLVCWTISSLYSRMDTKSDERRRRSLLWSYFGGPKDENVMEIYWHPLVVRPLDEYNWLPKNPQPFILLFFFSFDGKKNLFRLDRYTNVNYTGAEDVPTCMQSFTPFIMCCMYIGGV